MNSIYTYVQIRIEWLKSILADPEKADRHLEAAEMLDKLQSALHYGLMIKQRVR